jgi:prepilin-type N-terminal cleavage/methylation domain-containing protein
MISKSKATDGFTLVEVLVVIFFISVLIGVAVPSFVSSIKSAQLNASVSQLVSDLRKSQAKSMATGQRYGIRFTAGSNEYEMIISSGGAVEVLESRKLMTKVILLSSTFTDNIITFKRSGSPSESGSATLQYSGGTNKVISVAAVTGRVRIN